MAFAACRHAHPRSLDLGDWGDAHGWDDAAIAALFGRESANGDTEHLRGALVFWDVIPQIKGDSLTVEIMTPHQSHYYQEKRDHKAGNSITPHDSGQPNPISFLTVPPKSGFVFHVQCDLAHLDRIAPALAANGLWKTLLEAAFIHAFKWLGFGAKTAVGYGAMGEDPEALVEHEKNVEAARQAAVHRAEEARRATLSPDDVAFEDHSQHIETFREQFDAASQSAYQPGSLFDNQRNEFVKIALDWQDVRSRLAAGELLEKSLTKVWGLPGNKDSKQRMKNAVEQLKGQT